MWISYGVIGMMERIPEVLSGCWAIVFFVAQLDVC
jgi:hypothetical protein